jgi:RimJ/RimL family protein N-acetyltransferase
MDAAAEAEFIESLARSKASTLLVGRIDGEIACVGSLFASGRERIAHQGDLALSVKKKYWHMGVGTALMHALIHFARQTGQSEILHLGVRSDNEHAIHLYKKMGFEEIGLYKKYFKIGGVYADELLMNLYL